MKIKAVQIRNTIFWLLIAIFAALAAGIAIRWTIWGHRMPLWGFAVIAIVFCALGTALLVMTLKLKGPLMQRIFFILTGASAAAIPVCAILHNVVYGLFFHGTEGDEAVFFVLALLVFPALFVIGALGNIVLMISARLKEEHNRLRTT